MGLIRFVVIAGAVGIGVVAWSQRHDPAGLTADLRTAGEQARAAKDFCNARPELCAKVAGNAADFAKQDLARRLGAGDAAPETTGRIADPPARAALPANPPLPPRRPAAFP